jgi:hypothetical protein
LKVGRLSVSFLDAVALSFLDSLECKLDEYEGIQALLKEAEKRRSSLEARLAKVRFGPQRS